MGQKKTFLNNLWKKNYSINKIFFEDINKKKFLKYLKKQKYIDYNLINKNFSLIYDKKFPIAFLLKNKKKIVGFLGTLFSIRKINKKKFIFCNIHSWLVDVPHRIAADLLFKDILNKSIITVLSARKGLSKTFNNMGFKKVKMNYRVTFLLNPTNLFYKKKTGIYSDISLIKNCLDKNNLEIFEKHSHKNFMKLIIYNLKNKSEFSFLIAKIVKKKKLFRVINIIYLTNSSFIKKNLSSMYINMFYKFNILFCGQHFLKEEECILQNSFFSQNSSKDIYLKNFPKRIRFNTLFSEFDAN
jgi:hypothetical protein